MLVRFRVSADLLPTLQYLMDSTIFPHNPTPFFVMKNCVDFSRIQTDTKFKKVGDTFALGLARLAGVFRQMSLLLCIEDPLQSS